MLAYRDREEEVSMNRNLENRWEGKEEKRTWKKEDGKGDRKGKTSIPSISVNMRVSPSTQTTCVVIMLHINSALSYALSQTTKFHIKPCQVLPAILIYGSLAL